MSLTLITTLKPFQKTRSWDVHQYSALYSWSLHPQIKVIVVGVDDEEGKQICAQHNYTLIQDVLRAYDIGYYSQCPILTEVIRAGLDHSDSEWFGYINSDIIIHPNFTDKFNEVIESIPLTGDNPFISTLRRDFQLDRRLSAPEDLENLINYKWDFQPKIGSDIFIAKRSLWKEALKTMPKFILGRYGWDNYFHKLAIVDSNYAVDASHYLINFHPHHGRPMNPTDSEVLYNQSLYNYHHRNELYSLNHPAWHIL